MRHPSLNKGSLLLELLIAIALLAIILSVGSEVVFVSLQSGKVSGERDVGVGLATEALEGVRGATEENWQNIYSITGKSSTHYQATSTVPAGKWTIVAGDETIILNNTAYTRYVTIDNVSRDSTTRAIEPSYVTADDDPSTQKVTVTVSWTNADPVTISEYFFRWKNKVCSQGSWIGVGGSGNTVQPCGTTTYDIIDPTASVASGSFSVTSASSPTYVAAGNVAASTKSTTVALPNGIAVDDVMLMVIETANQAIAVSAPNGGTWTELTSSPQGTGTAGGTASTRLTIFWSRYNGAQGNPTISDSGDHQRARIFAFRGVLNTGNPWETTSGDVLPSASTAVTIPGGTVTSTSDLIVLIVANGTDTNTAQCGNTWTNASLSGLIERSGDNTSQGNGGGTCIATASPIASGAYTQTTTTLATASTQGRISLALKPSGSSILGAMTSSVFDTLPSGGGFNSIFWKGTLGGAGLNEGKVRFQFAASNCANGATNDPACTVGSWNYLGGATCSTGDWFDPGAPNTPIELTGATCQSTWNNKRYFKYMVEACSNDCVTAGANTPTVSGVVVNWAP